MASNVSLLDDTDDIADMPELQMSGPVRHTPGMHYEPSHHHSEREKKLMESYEALDYDIVENTLYRLFKRNQSREGQRLEWLADWMVYGMTGLGTGTTAFGIFIGVEQLLKLKFWATLKLVESDQMFGAYMVYVLMSMLFCLISSAMVSFIEPAAGGSGIPELKGYLNGTNYIRILRIPTLVVKAIGVVFSVSGGLAIGKEGPLVHSGAAVAANVSHAPRMPEIFNRDSFKRFRNDHDKRNFVSAGTAAGVAVAFGAPIGGVLFSLEEACSFWSLPLTWRTFFAAMCASFFLNVLRAIKAGSPDMDSNGLLEFGRFISDSGYTVYEIPVFAAIGIIGGLLGGLFNHINDRLCIWRRDRVKGNPYRCVAEVLLITFVSTTLQFMAPVLVSGCTKIPATQNLEGQIYRQYRCEDGHYSDMATLIFAPLENSIKAQFHDTGLFSTGSLLVYCIIIFFLAVTTYGISVPSGLFVPCILVGSGYGRLIGELIKTHYTYIDPGVYALVGATSMLGGVTRMTISLAVILVETTGNLRFLLPIMLALMVSKWVGDLFNISLYDMHVEIKCVPFVEPNPPQNLRALFARDVMNTPVVTFREKERVGHVLDVLRSCTHNGFPVVRPLGDAEKAIVADAPATHSDEPICVGIILRNQLATLIRKGAYFDEDDTLAYKKGLQRIRIEDFATSLQSRTANLDSLSIDESHLNKIIDLRPFMNPAPYVVGENWPLTRVYRLYRSLGLRHLPVVNLHNQLVGILSRKELQTDFRQDLS